MRWALLLILLAQEATAQRPRLSRKPPAADDFDAKSISITGTVTQADAKTVVVDASDHRILTFKIEKATKLPAAALEPGDHVKVQATQDQEAYLTAKEISIDKEAVKIAAKDDAKAATAGSQPPTQAKVSAPPVYLPAKPDPEDEGPPKLRYGKPNPAPAKPLPPEPADSPGNTAATSVSVEPSAVSTESKERGTEPPAPAPSPNAALIERAREWALTFTSALPNYVCQQFTTRYLKPTGQRDWQAKDVVSANVVFENGKEDYRNIAINGKAQSKKMEDLPGSWSTGEFGTTLRSLFSPGRRAIFRFVKQSQIIGMTASVYDYSVKREYSDWRIQLGGQAVIPAYSGRVWIDQKTARVIRIEVQADDIPVDFPLDKVESSNEYGLIRLATADQYMLPSHAETLSCERGTTFCSRNAIEFRNYHKYSGEANITF